MESCGSAVGGGMALAGVEKKFNATDPNLLPWMVRKTGTDSIVLSDLLYSEKYKPGPGFEEDTKDPLIDISLTDSTELWLIQWPINQLKAADFHGKELKLKLHRDGQLGSLESSSGKSYDVVSFAAQEPDATVFLPSSPESKIGSMRKSMSRSGKFESISRDTLTSVHSLGQRSVEFSQHSKKKKRHEDSAPNSDISLRSAERSSHTSGPESQITDTTLGSEESKKKKKKKIKVEE
ncbi:putative mediator-associated protein 2 [Cocos nucifera]|uniref:Putative mediator-associated protein 2 n=1 Tax=Cocos nucifera TaxID=13894 RepID=A0A8K0I0Z5_COCNU|nr:putative mediator-associated protein 2 [Cocos nucifera]